MPEQAKSFRKKKSDATADQSIDQPLGDNPPNLITVDDVSYETESLPDEVKDLLKDLLRFNHEAEELQFRLRQIQAAQQKYYEIIKAQIIEKGVQAYQP